MTCLFWNILPDMNKLLFYRPTAPNLNAEFLKFATSLYGREPGLMLAIHTAISSSFLIAKNVCI